MQKKITKYVVQCKTGSYLKFSKSYHYYLKNMDDATFFRTERKAKIKALKTDKIIRISLTIQVIKNKKEKRKRKSKDFNLVSL